jgi:hypothetical protein
MFLAYDLCKDGMGGAIVLISSPYLHAQHARFLSSFNLVNGNFRCRAWISKLLETITSGKIGKNRPEAKKREEEKQRQNKDKTNKLCKILQ